jgi:phage terminase large subunit
VTSNAWTVTIPTVREEGAEIWVMWRSQEECDTYSLSAVSAGRLEIRRAEFAGKPFFPKILNTTRLDDLKNRPDQYDWVWNGGFRTVVEGAYYSKLLLLAKEQQRIDFVPIDPLMQVRAYFDIGGTGVRGCNGSVSSSVRKSMAWTITRRARATSLKSIWNGCAPPGGAKPG